ncbi:MAG TPA: hypothetical protein VGD06_08195 [Acidobacteriota bacterium]
MSPRIVYCHCAYADILPAEVKREVLRRLSAAGVAFEAVPDLCEMSARKDPALQRIADAGPVRIAACFPRAVQWLFHAAGSPLPEEGVEVLNQREQSAEAIVERLLSNEAPAAQPAGAELESAPKPISGENGAAAAVASSEADETGAAASEGSVTGDRAAAPEASSESDETGAAAPEPSAVAAQEAQE